MNTKPLRCAVVTNFCPFYRVKLFRLLAGRIGARFLFFSDAAEKNWEARNPRGGADLIVAMEPLEALRHLPLLAPDGWVITATEPVRNCAGYPEPAALEPQAGEVVVVACDESTAATPDNDEWRERREMAKEWRGAFARLGERGP